MFKQRRDDEHRETKTSDPDSETRRDAKHSPPTEPSAEPDASPVSGLEPIRAWRGITLVASEVSVGMTGTSDLLVGGEQARAICRKGEDHQVPHWKCECGYYAVKDITAARAYGSLAEVDLYGTVIEHEDGYRSEYMRILSLRIPRAFCHGGFLCSNTPELVFFPETITKAMGNGYSYPYQPPACAICTKCASDRKRVATLQQIAERVQCEVRWEEDHPTFTR